MIKQITKTLFVAMLLLFAVPFGAFAANSTNTTTGTNNTIAVVVNTSLNMGGNSTTNTSQTIPVTNSTNTGVVPVINYTNTTTSNGTSTVGVVVGTTAPVNGTTSNGTITVVTPTLPVGNTSLNTTPVQTISQPIRVDPENYEQEVPETQEISESDKKYITDDIGAKLRFLELKNRIDFQSQAAAMILNKISELQRESSFNMTTLTDASTNFESISVNMGTTDLNSLSTTQIADLYVSYKKEAISATIAFKTALAPGLTKTEKSQLKRILKRKYEAHKKIKDSRIEKLKSEFNNKRVKKVLNQFAMNNPEIVKKYESGQISMGDLRKELKNKYDSMSELEKKDLRNRIAEDNKREKINFIKKREEIKSKVESLRAEHRKIFEERKSEFKKKFEQKHSAELKKFKERTFERENSIKEFEKKHQERFDRFKENQRNNFQEKKEHIKNKFQERRDNFRTNHNTRVNHNSGSTSSAPSNDGNSGNDGGSSNSNEGGSENN